jgi:hypothetical protein
MAATATLADRMAATATLADLHCRHGNAVGELSDGPRETGDTCGRRAIRVGELSDRPVDTVVNA